MALKRRDAILAAIAVFIAWGYLTHWLPKLHYLPYVFLAGALATVALLAWLVLTTAWDTTPPSDGEVNYGPRHIAFLAPEKWRVEREALTKRNMYMMEPLYPASYAVSDSIDVLVGLVLRDFVKSWYGGISKSPTFVNEVDRAVRAALGEIRDRLLAVDMVETVVSRMIPLVTEHLRASYEAERAVRGRKLSRNVTDSEELDVAIAAKYRDGRLHPAASLAYSNTTPIQQQHLRSIVARLLPRVMPPTMTTSSAVNVLIKEIVACAVLSPVMQMLADPDTWNQLMEGYVSLSRAAAASSDHGRAARCYRRGRQSESYALHWMNMRRPRRRTPGMFSSPNWRLVTTKEGLRGSSELSGRPTLWQTRVASAATSPASCAKTRRSRARTLFTLDD
jgi:sorting nexin-25